MKASELVGKLAIRTAPVGSDYSMTTEPILIKAATDSHILYTYPKDTIMGRMLKNEKVYVLNCMWCDNSWTNYENLMYLAVPPRNNAVNF